MGYTHGRKWTDEDIKSDISKVKNWLGIDRMPTRSECVDYFGDFALTVAVSRREGGWYKLAAELNLPIKDSETTLGKECEKWTKDKLTNMGYFVESMSVKFPYDLLVNRCVKIDVKASRLCKVKDGSFYSFRVGKEYATCDIYILLALNDNKEVIDTYVVPSADVIQNKQISIGEINSKYSVYKNNWTIITKYSSFLRGNNRCLN